MAYCNWLSEQDGIDPKQWCYNPAALTDPQSPGEGDIYELAQAAPLEIAKVAEAADATKTGYRLPTEVEWEYCCRAGAETTRFFGNDADVLDAYALHRGNSHLNVFEPVARRMPNDFGLFDTLGGVDEWCQHTWGKSTTKVSMPEVRSPRSEPSPKKPEERQEEIDDSQMYPLRSKGSVIFPRERGTARRIIL